MDECCGAKQGELEKLAGRQRRVLWVVLVINLIMFFVEGAYGWLSRSTALQADSLDMLGDTIVYGVSLFAIHRGTAWTRRVSLFKGALMACFGLWVLLQAVLRFFRPELPIAETMGWVGSAALLANLCCALLLLRHRSDDINMRSTWLCSRNDVIANLGVLVAAAAVAYFHSRYPDLIIGAVISGLVLKSAYSVVRESLE